MQKKKDGKRSGVQRFRAQGSEANRNSASHSAATGVFFAFKDNGKENRSWESILKLAEVLSFSSHDWLSAGELNTLMMIKGIMQT